jgi:uncharacterized protein YbjQ (UPF0145 family)
MAPAEAPDTDSREQAESIARVEAGDIPLQAERRLSGLRESGGSFTSDLSTADFALCHQLGLRPVSQVMGSSIYQVGYQGATFGMGGSYAIGGAYGYGGGLVSELRTLSDAWNQARTLALSRLAREAALVSADAVVGVHLRADAGGWADSMSSGVIEYSVIGTAVRRERPSAEAGGADRATGRTAGARERGARERERTPVLTELTVADYAKLLAAGIEPAGIAAWSAVFFSLYGFGNLGGPMSVGMTENFEVREFTQAIYAAREQVMERMGAQAQSLGASGIVGVRISHSIARQDVGQSNRAGLMVTFHAIGTAVHDSGTALPAAPKPTIDLLA